MQTLLVKNCYLASKGYYHIGDVFCLNGRIAKIGRNLNYEADLTVDFDGKTLLPGPINDQVHFRGLNQSDRETVFTGSRAAAIGGWAAYIEQPNTDPQLTSYQLFLDRLKDNTLTSMINFGVNFGITNNNQEEVDKVITRLGRYVAGFKVFLGSSSGNMLVEDIGMLMYLISQYPQKLKIFHAEIEDIIRKNLDLYRKKVDDGLEEHARLHPFIRDVEACFEQSNWMTNLLRQNKSRGLIYHVSTAKEWLELPISGLSLEERYVFFEACLPHVFFNDQDYEEFGNLIKCNPAIKSRTDQLETQKALADGRADIYADDHAPHLRSNKELGYFDAPSGIPSVEFSLTVLMDMVSKNNLSLERAVELVCHNPATIFGIQDRGRLEEGYHADFTIFESKEWTPQLDDVSSKCGWSPFVGHTFQNKVHTTIVNGNIVYTDGVIIDPAHRGMPLEFG